MVRVIFDPSVITYTALLKNFWENHNPTTKDRQGNDSGPMYRSAIYCMDEEQLELAKKSADIYQKNLQDRGVTGNKYSTIYHKFVLRHKYHVSTRVIFFLILPHFSFLIIFPGEVTTEIKIDSVFYYAEDYHQQYLYKNPGGYCSMRGTGVKCTL